MAPASDTIPLQTEEQALLDRARRGDRHSRAALVERYWERLYRWLYHVTHNQAQAEELAQATFRGALSGLELLRPGRAFGPWLFAIAHDLFVRRRRDSKPVRQPVPEKLPKFRGATASGALKRDALLALTRAVGQLPTEFRAAYLLRAEERWTFAEIANVLDVTVEVARGRVCKARQKLLRVLGPLLERYEL